MAGTKQYLIVFYMVTFTVMHTVNAGSMASTTRFVAEDGIKTLVHAQETGNGQGEQVWSFRSEDERYRVSLNIVGNVALNCQTATGRRFVCPEGEYNTNGTDILNITFRPNSPSFKVEYWRKPTYCNMTLYADDQSVTITTPEVSGDRGGLCWLDVWSTNVNYVYIQRQDSDSSCNEASAPSLYIDRDDEDGNCRDSGCFDGYVGLLCYGQSPFASQRHIFILYNPNRPFTIFYKSNPSPVDAVNAVQESKTLTFYKDYFRTTRTRTWQFSAGYRKRVALEIMGNIVGYCRNGNRPARPCSAGRYDTLKSEDLFIITLTENTGEFQVSYREALPGCNMTVYSETEYEYFTTEQAAAQSERNSYCWLEFRTREIYRQTFISIQSLNTNTCPVTLYRDVDTSSGCQSSSCFSGQLAALCRNSTSWTSEVNQTFFAVFRPDKRHTFNTGLETNDQNMYHHQDYNAALQWTRAHPLYQLYSNRKYEWDIVARAGNSLNIRFIVDQPVCSANNIEVAYGSGFTKRFQLNCGQVINDLTSAGQFVYITMTTSQQNIQPHKFVLLYKQVPTLLGLSDVTYTRSPNVKPSSPPGGGTNSTSDPVSKPLGQSGNRAGVIAGSVIATIAVVVVIVGAVLFFKVYKPRQKDRLYSAPIATRPLPQVPPSFDNGIYSVPYGHEYDTPSPETTAPPAYQAVVPNGYDNLDSNRYLDLLNYQPLTKGSVVYNNGKNDLKC